MTLAASDYMLSTHKEMWLVKVEEIPVESAQVHFSVELVCPRPDFPLARKEIAL